MIITMEVQPSDDFGQKLEDALITAGSKRAVIGIPVGGHKIEEPHVIPENVTLDFPKGAFFEISNNISLTITGGVQAPPEYIFRGDGKVEGSISGDAYVQWFGADFVEDKDHTAVFQNALNTCKTIFVPNRETGYFISNLNISSPVEIKGIGSIRVDLNIIESSAVSYLDISSSNVRVENFTIKCLTDSNNELAVYINTGKNDLENIYLSNVTILNPGFGIGDTGSKNHTAKNVELHNIGIESNRNTGVQLTDLTTGIVLKDVVVSSFGGEVPGNQSKGYIFENIEEMYMENVDVLGGFPKAGDSGDGMTFINCKNVSSYRIMIDYVNGRQVVIKDCSGFKMSNFVTSLIKTEGFYIDNLQDSVFDVFKVNGVYPTEVPALFMKNCNNVVFNVLIVQLTGKEGIVMENCTNNTFNNLVISDCKGPALIEKGNSNNNTFNGLRSKSNDGGISLVGTKTAVYGYIGNDGEIAAKITGSYSD
ncbi:MAG: right-handed parallel beta-helix repeat-containing protein [Saccharofermentanales bacterium]